MVACSAGSAASSDAGHQHDGATDARANVGCTNTDGDAGPTERTLGTIPSNYYFPAGLYGVGPQIDDGRVVFQEAMIGGEEVGGTDLFFDAPRADTRTRITRSAINDVLLGVADGRILSFSVRSPIERSTWVVRDFTGQLVGHFDFEEFAHKRSDGTRHQVFDGIRVLTFDDHVLAVSRVDTERTRTIEIADETVLEAILFGAKTAFLAKPESQDSVRLYTWGAIDGIKWVTLVGTHPHDLVADGGRLFWLADQGVYTFTSGGAAKSIYEGNCRFVDANDGLAVFGCGDAFETNSYRDQVADQLLLFDGSEVRHLDAVSESSGAVEAAVWQGGVAWAEISHPDVLCSGYDPEPGEVFYLDIGNDQRRKLGELRPACRCCSIAPAPLPFRITADQGLVAWNYGVSTHYDGPIRVGASYAVADLHGLCE